MSAARGVVAVVVVSFIVPLLAQAQATARTPLVTTPRTRGCGTRRTVGTSTLTLQNANRRRTAIVHVPRGYAASRPTALVLDLHGSGSTATEQEAFSGMDASADSDGFLVAYPQALLRSGTGYDWNVPAQPLFGGASVPSGAANDVAFLSAVVRDLESRYCVDRSHVDVTGFSGGARMASQLACDVPSVFAAVAPVSGLRYPTPCPTTRAVPVVAFHGDADPVDPYGGHGQAYWTESVPQAAQDWAQHDRCAKTPQESTPSPGAQMASYHGCADGSAVELYTLTGEGHEWPGGPRLPARLTQVLGPQSTAVNANDVMWLFFSTHPLRAA
jgi:polyhydroxybutyrate depolymerase